MAEVDRSSDSLIRSYFKAFSSGDPKAVSSHVTDGFINRHLGVLGGGCETKVVYEERLSQFLATFAQLRYDVFATCIGSDGQASARYAMHFVQDGKPFEVPGMMWFELSGGLIAKRTDCWDGLTYLKQAGADAAAIAAML